MFQIFHIQKFEFQKHGFASQLLNSSYCAMLACQVCAGWIESKKKKITEKTHREDYYERDRSCHIDPLSDKSENRKNKKE